MEKDGEYTTKTIEYYNAATSAYGLSPLEFLVWHGLVHACSINDDSLNHYYSVSIADVARTLKVQRETIRRAIMNLQKKGLAKRIGNRWIFETVQS
jgi:predicted transcriptional regulator